MEPVEVALSYINAFSTGEPDQVASHVSEDFYNDQVGELGSSFRGRDLYRQRLSSFLKTFDGLQYTVEKVVDGGDSIAIAYHMTARDKGRPINVRGVMVITVANGKVTSRSDYWDGLTYLKQTETQQT